jgi:site-specific DNA-methyltransferase (adenine-specific)
MSIEILVGDCRELLRKLPDCSVDSVVTDPPYELGFMGKSWDSTGVAYDVSLWGEVLRVLKPGGHLLAFSGSRTYHRMAVAIEDTGFEIRDQIMWVYGSGFPKSLDIAKSIENKLVNGSAAKNGFHKLDGERQGDGDVGMYNTVAEHGFRKHNPKQLGAFKLDASTQEAQQWQGWGTALKPAHEPIVMARKPIDGTVANNVLKHGVGGINIDGCRVHATDSFGGGAKGTSGFAAGYTNEGWVAGSSLGRFPANFIHDGSDEVLALTGDAARFFYCAKAGKAERNAGLEGMPERRPDERTQSGMGTFAEKGVAVQSNFHPTVKPLTLMRYLVRLVTPPNGTVLDPFTGSGTTLMAATMEGFNAIGMEMTEEYVPIINGRVLWAKQQVSDTLF